MRTSFHYHSGIRDRCQILHLISSKFKQINELPFFRKPSENFAVFLTISWEIEVNLYTQIRLILEEKLGDDCWSYFLIDLIPAENRDQNSFPCFKIKSTWVSFLFVRQWGINKLNIATTVIWLHIFLQSMHEEKRCFDFVDIMNVNDFCPFLIEFCLFFVKFSDHTKSMIPSCWNRLLICKAYEW